MARRLAARNGGRIGLAALVAILLLGLGLRLEEAWDGRAPVYDASAYAAIAANLDRGKGFTAGAGATQPSSDYSPGLPLFAAGVYELSGGVHEQLARVVLALIGSLSVLFAYLIGRRLSGPLAGLIAATAIAVYPALLEYQGMLMSEPLAATLLAGSILAILWAWDRPSPWRWLLPGALLGATALARPEYLGVAVLLALVVFVRRASLDWRRSLARAAILLGGVVLVMAPWTIRNAIALDRFVPVSTGAGQVLFAGTYLPSDGDPERVSEEVLARHPELFAPQEARRLRLEQILARLAAERYPDLETDKALSRMGREQLWDDVSEEPLEYLDFLATKVGRIWSHGPRDVMREPGWQALHWALIALGLLGLALLAWRRRWEALLLGAVFLAISAICALLVASPRRVLVAMPLVAALAGVGVAWAAETLGRDSRHRVLGPRGGQEVGSGDHG
jgi:4-amino-4-deoxy-L-arabinose transferase-like glycosyltransferase